MGECDILYHRSEVASLVDGERQMGDIIKSFKTRSAITEKSRLIKFYFDTGSPRTFVKQSVALKMREVTKLSYPEIFSGLGNGSFKATHILRIQIKLKDVWVPHLCYVVDDEVLEPNYDVLLGHDFMQVYDIQVKPKQKEVVVKKESLKMGLKVRRIKNATEESKKKVALCIKKCSPKLKKKGAASGRSLRCPDNSKESPERKRNRKEKRVPSFSLCYFGQSRQERFHPSSHR